MKMRCKFFAAFGVIAILLAAGSPFAADINQLQRGFEVQQTYPLQLDGELPGVRNHKLLSPEHLAALRFVAQKAKEMGLRMDLTLGSGWPYGGPAVEVGSLIHNHDPCHQNLIL